MAGTWNLSDAPGNRRGRRHGPLDRRQSRVPQGHSFDRVDSICISHGHFDHIHDAVPLAQKFSPQVVAIYETCHWLESKGVEEYLSA